MVSGSSLEAALAAIDAYLQFRTYMVGHAISLADVVLWGQLQGDWLNGQPHAFFYVCVCDRLLATRKDPQRAKLRHVANMHGPDVVSVVVG